MRIFLFLFLQIIIARQNCIQGELSEDALVSLSVKCFNEKYNPQLHDGHKLSRTIQNKLTTYRKMLQHLKMHKVKHTEATPVVKWAQTKQKIFIAFKLSHRQDSPPCSDVRNDKFILENINEIQAKLAVQKNTNQTLNVSKIDFSGQCFFTNQKFMFKLSMTLNSSLSSISIDREGFGSYTIVGQKSTSEIWIDPFQDVHRAAIWQQMRERYANQMNQYFDMRQKRLQDTEQKKRNKKKKRPVNKTSSGPQKQVQQEEKNKQKQQQL